MADDEHDPFAPTAQPVQPVLDQLSTDTPALLVGLHGHWCQRHGRNRSARWRLNQYATEEDVPDDLAVPFGHERREDRAFGAQAVDEIRFVGTTKGRLVDATH